ncbi:MAG: matrixin family metalloprotease [Polyangiaceae bacterium]|nr:matrixin family metalloprotease [Polyangiaceae bacterium]
MAVWSNAQCGDAKLGIDAVPFPAVVCDQAEYNTDGPNANIWVFRDDDWPYPDDGRTLALTLVTFNVKTGEIYDADVEVNSYASPLSREAGATLAEIATHEAGHIYGMAHSSDPHAIMFPNYSTLTGISAELTDDDQAGICSIYPPGRGSKSCDATPRHGFSAECGRGVSGCAVSPPCRSQSTGWTAWVAAGLLLLVGRKSRG